MSSDEATLPERLRFSRIDEDTRRTLREIKPLVENALPAILTDFYNHVALYPEPARLFGGSPAKMDMAKNAQIAHWRTILSADFGPAYVQSVRRIGQTHARIGLAPRWYVGGYQMIQNGVIAELIKANAPSGLLGKSDPDKLSRQIAAFNKALMLDVDFALSIYVEESDNARKKMAQELADTFDRQVSGVVSTVASAATELEQTARVLATGAERSATRADTVASSAEETTANIAAAAAAAGQLGQAVSEISRQAGESARVARDAAAKAAAANETIDTLNAAAARIGQVVRLISDIAGKTNLLALNATIEAARAGQAGRGFAVVAAEVKALADQTAKATDEIGSHVTEIQAVTERAVSAIEAIQDTISSIDQATGAISAAVEEQSASTQEIARNAGDAAQGAGVVSRNISDVQASAQETGAAASQVVSASEELAKQAETLRSEVNRFLHSVRAA
jgi:methyl-accepting chemotaxis protein